MPHPPLGPVRCPACGQLALPMQTRCLSCNSRLNQPSKVEQKASDAIQTAPSTPLPAKDGKCPACGNELSSGAVLCIGCGYDLRTGRKRGTIHALADDELDADSSRREGKRSREPLPAGLGNVQLGLGFHYARLVVTLLAVFVVMVALCYGVTVKAKGDDVGLMIGTLTAVGLVVLAAVLGMAGSVLCLWVGKESRAWGFIFVSLLLDVLALPLVVFMHFAALTPLAGWAVQFISWILFMLFLRRLALYIDRPSEANEVMALITRGVALLVGVPLVLVLLAQFALLYATLSNDMSRLILVVSVVIIVVQFILLIRLVFTIVGNIQTLRAAIASRLPGREGEKSEQSRVIPDGEKKDT